MWFCIVCSFLLWIAHLNLIFWSTWDTEKLGLVKRGDSIFTVCRVAVERTAYGPASLRGELFTRSASSAPQCLVVFPESHILRDFGRSPNRSENNKLLTFLRPSSVFVLASETKEHLNNVQCVGLKHLKWNLLGIKFQFFSKVTQKSRVRWDETRSWPSALHWILRLVPV